MGSVVYNRVTESDTPMPSLPRDLQ